MASDETRAAGSRDEAGASAPHPETPVTRRAVIGAVGALGATGPVMLALGCEAVGEALGMEPSASASASASFSDEAHRLEHAHWHELVGESFIVEDSPFHDSDDGAGERLTLLQAFDEEIADDPDRPDHLRAGAISLLFVASPRTRMPNATYTVRHSDLGRFHLFLHEMPRDDHKRKRIYEAVLN